METSSFATRRACVSETACAHVLAPCCIGRVGVDVPLPVVCWLGAAVDHVLWPAQVSWGCWSTRAHTPMRSWCRA